MSLIINISQAYPSVPPIAPPTPRANAARIAANRYLSDAAELSHTTLRKVVALSSLRIATTTAIRAEIEAGTYETPQRIEGTVERLLDVIG